MDRRGYAQRCADARPNWRRSRCTLMGLEQGYGVEQMPRSEGMERAEKEERQAGHMEPSEEGFAQDGFGAVHVITHQPLHAGEKARRWAGP